MIITRRSIVGGLIGIIAAPAIVKASSLMPVKNFPLATVYMDDLDGLYKVVTRIVKNGHDKWMLESVADWRQRSTREWPCVKGTNLSVGSIVRIDTLVPTIGPFKKFEWCSLTKDGGETCGLNWPIEVKMT